MFKYFDTELVGRLDYSQFFAAMTRLNFVGVQARHFGRPLYVVKIMEAESSSYKIHQIVVLSLRGL